MTKSKTPIVVVVIKDGTVDNAYCDSEIRLVVAEPDMNVDDEDGYIWEPLIGPTEDLSVSEDLRDRVLKLIGAAD